MLLWRAQPEGVPASIYLRAARGTHPVPVVQQPAALPLQLGPSRAVMHGRNLVGQLEERLPLQILSRVQGLQLSLKRAVIWGGA